MDPGQVENASNRPHRVILRHSFLKILYADGREDDSKAIRALLRGLLVLEARLQVEIDAPSLHDLPCGVYRVKTPSRWPFHSSTEGWHRRHFGSQQQFSH
jgi:hypothetical protein